MVSHGREMKVAIVAIISFFILYFGINFLKGRNIFVSANHYVGVFQNINGLENQAPVYVRGYKVGQVSDIKYDFTSDSAFTVVIVINDDVCVENSSTMCLVADGLLGGTAVELRIPSTMEMRIKGVESHPYQSYDTLPTLVIPGLIQTLQDGLIVSLTETVDGVKDLVGQLKGQMDNDHLKNILGNVDNLSYNLNSVGKDMKVLFRDKVPTIVDDIDTSIQHVKVITAKLQEVEFSNTMGKVDSVLDNLNLALEPLHQPNNTVGLLLKDSSLYNNINTAIVSVDSLLVDLKAHPKRYVHFSLFGKKDKDKKKK